MHKALQENIINLLMWMIMATMFGYFAYSKGWIGSDFKNITPQEAHHLLEHNASITWVDVRSLSEFNKDHIKGAIHVAMEDLNHIPLFEENTTLLVYSERGERSIEAARLLAKRGFNILHLQGGVVFWVRAGYKIQKQSQ